MQYDLSELNNVQQDYCKRYLSGQSIAQIVLDTNGNNQGVKRALDLAGIEIRPETRSRKKA